MDIGFVIDSVFDIFAYFLQISFTIYGMRVSVGGMLLFTFILLGLCILMERMGF